MKEQNEINKLRAELQSTMKAQGFNQLDICRETGIRQSTVSLFLGGHRSLSGDAALRVAKFLRLCASSTATIPVLQSQA